MAAGVIQALQAGVLGPRQRRRLRTRVANVAQLLVDLLDALDGDPDLETTGEDAEDGHDLETVNEDGGDVNDEPEPSLGAPETGAGSQIRWANGGAYDREAEAGLPPAKLATARKRYRQGRSNDRSLALRGPDGERYRLSRL